MASCSAVKASRETIASRRRQRSSGQKNVFLRRLGRGECLRQWGKEKARFSFDVYVGNVVAPSGTEVHDAHGLTGLGSSSDEPVAGVHGQGRAGNEQNIDRFEELPRLVDAGGGGIFSEKDDVRFQDASTRPTVGHPKRAGDVSRKIGVTVGRELGGL